MAESFEKSGVPPTRRQFLRIRPRWAVASVFLLLLSLAFAWSQAPFPRPTRPFRERSLLELLWYPIEANGPTRLPSAPASLFGSAVAADRT
jgi:hypothetical protein